MDVFGTWRDLLGSEPSKRVGDHGEFIGQIGPASQTSRARDEVGIGGVDDVLAHAVERVGVHAPATMLAPDRGRKVAKNPTDEDVRKMFVIAALVGVLQRRSGHRQRCGGVGNVVQGRLIVVCGRTGRAQMRQCAFKDVVSDPERCTGGLN